MYLSNPVMLSLGISAWIRGSSVKLKRFHIHLSTYLIMSLVVALIVWGNFQKSIKYQTDIPVVYTDNFGDPRISNIIAEECGWPVVFLTRRTLKDADQAFSKEIIGIVLDDNGRRVETFGQENLSTLSLLLNIFVFLLISSSVYLICEFRIRRNQILDCQHA